MATATAMKSRPGVKEQVFRWEGKNREGKSISGEMRAPTEAVVSNSLRRQGVVNAKITKQRTGWARKITEKDMTIFTRQLSTMIKAGVPLLQAFDIVGRGHSNPSVSKMLLEIKNDIESGSSMATAFRKFPLQFDALYCNLVAAGEQAGILDTLLDRLAVYKEKMLAIKGKIKSALFYPIMVLLVAAAVTSIIMVFVIPEFKKVFQSFGAELPSPTLVVIAMSDFVLEYWYIVFGAPILFFAWFFYTWKRSEKFQIVMDRFLLRLPLFGDLIRKSVMARWNRTLATMFAAGVPLVEALESVGGASGNYVYKIATQTIRTLVSSGTSLTVAVQSSKLFPNMVVQMIAIGEESGELDTMLDKIADFFEQEVDEAVASLSSLMEPILMVILGTLIGGLVIAMYLPIFKVASVI
jgi:type IV pilus assembly protein PilC